MSYGKEMYKWAKELWPICRSITGEGARTTLEFLKSINSELEIKEFPSGKQVFDWVIPDEWNIKDAWIKDESGQKIVDFKNSNLHIVGYSTPIHKKMTLDELRPHLHSLPQNPNAIPYVTSYYEPRWGFCLKHKELENLKDCEYEVFIDSSLEPGVMNYGELVIKGDTEEEVLLSTYVCHPSMANNELSGPILASAIAKYLKEQSSRRYTYRILFLSETIGSIAYISENLAQLKSKVRAGYVLSCVGDSRKYSIIASRYADTLSEKVLEYVLSKKDQILVDKYSYLQRGSDERQFCSPGVDLPICGFSRSKYGTYPEYHTSLDDLSLVTEDSLQESLDVMICCIEILENNVRYESSHFCEPQLGKRGLFPSLSKTNSISTNVRDMIDFLAYADGKNDLIDLSRIIGLDYDEVQKIAKKLVDHNLIKCS